MRRITFLPTEIFLSLVAILIYGILNFHLFWKVVLGLVISIVLFAFRRSIIPYQDTWKNNGEIFLAPVYGVVESIRRDTDVWEEYPFSHEVRISIGPFSEKGIYLPTSGEISHLKAYTGLKVNRYAPAENFYRPALELAHTDIELTSKMQSKSLLRFIDCEYGQRPNLWLKSGDRGRGAACFGHYLFGGTLVIYLPQHSDILVYEKEYIIPGETVIAAIKDMK